MSATGRIFCRKVPWFPCIFRKRYLLCFILQWWTLRGLYLVSCKQVAKYPTVSEISRQTQIKTFGRPLWDGSERCDCILQVILKTPQQPGWALSGASGHVPKPPLALCRVTLQRLSMVVKVLKMVNHGREGHREGERSFWMATWLSLQWICWVLFLQKPSEASHTVSPSRALHN